MSRKTGAPSRSVTTLRPCVARSAGDQPEHAAGKAEQHGLEHQPADELRARRAHHPPQPDLAPPLHHGRERRVGDGQRGDEQRDQAAAVDHAAQERERPVELRLGLCRRHDRQAGHLLANALGDAPPDPRRPSRTRPPRWRSAAPPSPGTSASRRSTGSLSSSRRSAVAKGIITKLSGPVSVGSRTPTTWKSCPRTGIVEPTSAPKRFATWLPDDDLVAVRGAG